MKTSLNFFGTATLNLPDGTEIAGVGSLVVDEWDGVVQGNGTLEAISPPSLRVSELTAPSLLRFRDAEFRRVIITRVDPPRLHFVTTGPVIRT